MEETKKKQILTAREMAYIAVCAVLISVCAWISVPSVVPFTMQTFGIFCVLGLLGGRRGTLCVLVYILMGLVGLPVFSGFSGGVGRLLGTTGGYIVGFLFTGLVYWLITAVFGQKLWSRILGLVLGLAVCYAFGTAWFVVVYAKSSGPIGFIAAMAKCVFPFIIPDLIKLSLALLLTRLLKKHISLA